MIIPDPDKTSQIRPYPDPQPWIAGTSTDPASRRYLQGNNQMISSSELRVTWTKGQLDYIEGLGTLGMHGKVEKIGVDPKNISPENP